MRLGIARASRAGFGASPKRTFYKLIAIRAEILVLYRKPPSTGRGPATAG